MKKEDIEKILQEADNSLGNFTDGQLRSHLTISKNRASKKLQSKGGTTSGNNRKKTKTGIFALSYEERKIYGKMGSIAQKIEDKAKGGRIAGKLRRDKGIPILMFNKITNKFIMEFPSVATAARYINRNKTAENKIRRVANGERKSSYGFIWKYKK
jgi:hypothetical protein